MALVTATKTGNWSDTTVWSTGALPLASDTVRANGFTVTIDQDVNIGTGTLDTLTSGGGFSVTAAPRSITANVTAGTSGCLVCSHNTGTVTLIGNIAGSATTTASGANNSGNGTLSLPDTPAARLAEEQMIHALSEALCGEA